MRSLVAAGVALAAVGLSGCTAFSSDSTNDGELRVAAGFYPLQYVAERVPP